MKKSKEIQQVCYCPDHRINSDHDCSNVCSTCKLVPREKIWQCNKHKAAGNHEMGCPRCYAEAHPKKRLPSFFSIPINKRYYYISDTPKISSVTFDADLMDRELYRSGNMFFKKSEAVKARNQIKLLLDKLKYEQYS